MSKKVVSPPTATEVRRNMVSWFYGLNKKGGAPRGIKDVCARIKEAYGYKGPLVKEHLTYLLDLDYIKREEERITVRTGQTQRDQPKITYRISAKGIEFMDGQSEFSNKDRFAGINITATGGSTVVLGDGNVVNSNFKSLHEELGKFRFAVADSTEINDASKLEATVAIDTIRGQLALPQPDQNIVEKAWETANRICTSATLIDYVLRLGPLVAVLFQQ